MTYSKAWGRPSAISYFAGATQLNTLTDATFDTDGRPITRTTSITTAPNPVTALPTAMTATYTNNRLTTFNGAAWTYDNQGNLTSDGTNTYIWDARNRLKEIKQGATTTALFEYDALNRRTKKTIGSATPIATEYVHDGLTPVQEKRSTDITQLITGPGIDDYLSRITTTIGATPTITTRNYLTDFLGSTQYLADDSGTATAIKTTYGYEPYGETTVAGESTSNSFQYTGRENDGAGLYYYRARYYSPKAKRFIAEDPIGQRGGINAYEYVESDPMNMIDPLGEFGLVGALIGGGLDLALQLAMNGGNLKCVNWTDVGLATVGGALTGGLANGNFALKLGSNKWRATREWLGKRWNLDKGQHVHHSFIEQNSAIGKMVPDAIKNQPWNLKPMASPEAHAKLHALDPFSRTVLGAPGYAQGIGLGAGIGAAGGGGKCECQ